MKISSLVARKFIRGYRYMSRNKPTPEYRTITPQIMQQETLPEILTIGSQVTEIQTSQIMPQIANIQPTSSSQTSIQQPTQLQTQISDVQRVETIKTSIAATGYEIPKTAPKYFKIESFNVPTKEKPIFLTYPLIPRNPAKKEPIFAYARIFWDEKNNRNVYQLVEPGLSDKLKNIYKKIKELLEQRLDIEFSKLKKIEAREYVDRQIDEILRILNLNISDTERKILDYYMNRDFIGLGVIEPLMRDVNLEDISCDGIGIPIFVFHKDPNLGSIQANIAFNDSDELDSFIIRLAQLCGKSISVAQPLLDGTLPDGSRLQSTLGTDIARKGSNFTIRKFPEEPLTPVHLLNYETLDTKVLAYLWLAVDYGRSLLVSGGTATGKTSLLNVLSLFIRPDKKIVSIEDTAELRLPHQHWVPVVARTPIATEGKSGEVDMFDLLKESLRQRPDYIIVGEVRGKEAYILFQQMATGHSSLATIHAENIQRLVDRLATPPISLPPGLISGLDIIIFLARLKYKNKFIRKTIEVVEMVEFDSVSNTPIINQVYKWDPQKDKFDVINKSIMLKKISDFTGLSEKDIRGELEKRMLILEWMKANQILDYRSVHKIFSYYETKPEELLALIQGEVW